MKIKKNGKVINLTESDLKRIVKRVLKENTQSEEDVVIECILSIIFQKNTNTICVISKCSREIYSFINSM